MSTLYKFVGDLSPVRAMVGGALKFTGTDALNDPSELVPIMNRDAVRDSLAAIRHSGYSDQQFEWLGRQEQVLRLLSPETQAIPRPPTKEAANRMLRSAVYENLDSMEKMVVQTIKLIRSRVGILSLTERYDSLPMWAHYGVQAQGFVVGFEGLERVFPDNETGSLNVLKPVRYVIDIVGMTHDPSTQDNLFFSKFADWSYEREWRVVTPLSHCEVSGTLHIRRVRPCVATMVICGWNVSAGAREALAGELKAINPKVQMRQAVLQEGRVVLAEASH